MALKDYYFTLSEAAKEAGVARQTVSRWITEDKLSVEKIGRETLVKKDDFKEHILQQRLIRDAADIYRGLIDVIRGTYNYTKTDEIKFDAIEPKKNRFHFLINRKDNKREKVTIKVKDPERIDMKSKDTVYIGYGIQIERIERRVIKK